MIREFILQRREMLGMHVCYIRMRNDHRSLTLWMLTLCMGFIRKHNLSAKKTKYYSSEMMILDSVYRKGP